MLDPFELVQQLIAIPGPPGQEEAVQDAVAKIMKQLGYKTQFDERGNVTAKMGTGQGPKILVTAHMDEIALMVEKIDYDGKIRVTPMGGLYPWKWGEQPVDIHSRQPVEGIVSFGCIHTNSTSSPAVAARTSALTWPMTYIFTGMNKAQLESRGVKPGTRVTLSQSRRQLLDFHDYVSGYFLDDRADVAALLMVMETLKGAELNGEIVFAATAAEEVGGHGALYIMQKMLPDVCIALEIGPSVPESTFTPDAEPTIWVNDGYAAMQAKDIILLEDLTHELGITPHWQALSRGGSDASCGASHGLCARPITLGLAVENSHGLEIMHSEAPSELARLTTALIRKLCS